MMIELPVISQAETKRKKPDWAKGQTSYRKGICTSPQISG
jgi:hypothetical protein